MSSSTHLARLAGAIQSAQISAVACVNIDLITPARRALTAHLVDILASLPAVSDRRCLLYHPATPRATPFISALTQAGWTMKPVPLPGAVDFAIIDRAVLLTWQQGGGVFRLHTLRNPAVVGQGAVVFEQAWVNTDSVEAATLIYEDGLAALGRGGRGAVSVEHRRYWDDLIRDLAGQPAGLFHLNPRKFEEVVAELLVREGLHVRLTAPTRDGGRDILATDYNRLGRHLYLVECKRYARDRPVTVDLIRSLYGVVEKENATAGLLVTTSHFTMDALMFAAPLRYRMTLQECDHLVQWLREIDDVRSDPPT